MTFFTITSILVLMAPLCAAVDVSSKAGLAWAGSPDQVAQFLQTEKISWYYHWSETPDIHQDIECAPQSQPRLS